MRRGRGARRGSRGMGRGASNIGPRAAAPPNTPMRSTAVAGPSALLSPPRFPVQLVDDSQRETILQWLAARGSASQTSSSSQSQPHRSSSPVGDDLNTSIPTVGISPNPYSEELFSAEMRSDTEGPMQTPEAGGEETLCSDAQSLMPVDEQEEAVLSPEVPCHQEHFAVASSPQLLASDCMEEEVSGDDETELDDETGDPTWADDPQLSRASSEDDDGVVSVPVRPQTGRGRSKKSADTVSSGSHTTPISPSKRSRTCLAWDFFDQAPDCPTEVICRLCRQRVSRGKNPQNLSTTCMNRHMTGKHEVHWNRHLSQKGHPGAPGLPIRPTTSSASASSSSAASKTKRSTTSATVLQEQTTSPERDTIVQFSPPVSPLTPSPSTSVNYTPYSSQSSVYHLWEQKKAFHQSHPKVKSLNVGIARLLAVEMLPFRLVDTDGFRHVMALACPQYQMPSRHFFARKAVPALGRNVAENIARSLAGSIAKKVHLTTDTWTSKHGQGRYVSLTAHWVTLVDSGGSGVGRTTTVSDTAGMVQRRDPLPPRLLSQAKRQQAVLKLMCLGDRPHTGTELWTALQAQFDHWLSANGLSPGKVVCDNGTNLLAALRIGGLTHIPCLAHVLNLVVQRFLTRYQGMEPLIRKARVICAHFRRSHPASAKLAALQRDLGLPVHRLICDVPTRWNSTLHMLQRLWQQRNAIMQYVMSRTRTSIGADLVVLSPTEWRQVKDLCTILASFEEGTKMVSADDALVSMTILVIFLLEQALGTLRQPVAEVAEEEEDANIEPYQEGGGEEELVRARSLRQPSRSSRTRVVAGQPIRTAARGPEASQGSADPHPQEEEEEEDEEEAMMDYDRSGNPSLFRGWQGVEAEAEEVEEEEEELTATVPRGFGDHGSIAHMSAWMLHYLQHDPRIQAIKRNSEYWVATLLDPRYKTKMSNFIPPSQIDGRMQEYQAALLNELVASFPSTETAVTGERTDQRDSSQLGQSGHRRRGRTLLGDIWQSIFTTSPVPVRQGRSQTHRDRLNSMVHEYLHLNIDAFGLSLDPFSFWVSKMEEWPELARYAIQVLSCPAASVISERTFSTAGGVITDRRIRLSPDNVDRLTFIKMNQAWISEDFVAPPADVTD